SYFKPKRPNYYAKTVPFQSCGSAVVPSCHSMNRSLWRVASQALSTVLAPKTMFPTKPILTRREPLKPTQRATLRIKLHIPLIKLIKKDQVCYSVAPSTTNQNATQRIYIERIKWLGKSL